jgi:hypothetical protein
VVNGRIPIDDHLAVLIFLKKIEHCFNCYSPCQEKVKADLQLSSPIADIFLPCYSIHENGPTIAVNAAAKKHQKLNLVISHRGLPITWDINSLLVSYLESTISGSSSNEIKLELLFPTL